MFRDVLKSRVGREIFALSSLIATLPILVVGALIWFFFVRQIRAAGKGALSFGKSKARLLTKAAEKYKVATQMGNQGYSAI